MTPSQQNRPNRGVLERGAIQGIKELFKKQGLEITDSELPMLRLHKPDYPPFPILIFLMALMKDIIDIFAVPGDTAGLTLIGLIATFSIRALTISFTLITSLIIFIWIWGRVSKVARAGIKSVQIKWIRKLIFRGSIGEILEIVVPYIPFTIIFVLLAHFHENKYVKLFLEAAEMLGKATKKGKSNSSGVKQALEHGRSTFQNTLKEEVSSRLKVTSQSSGEEQPSDEPKEGGMAEAGAKASKEGFGPI